MDGKIGQKTPLWIQFEYSQITADPKCAIRLGDFIKLKIGSGKAKIQLKETILMQG